MIKDKKIVIYSCITIIIYILLSYAFYYMDSFKEEQEYVYFVSEDIKRGGKLDSNNTVKFKLDKENVSNNKFFKGNLKGCVSKFNLTKGEILKEESIIAKEEFLKINNGMELVTIKIDDIDDNMSGILDSKNHINIYYTCKKEINNDILKKKANIKDENGRITYLLFSNIRILKLINKSGKEVSNSNDITNNIILIEMTKEEALLYKNIKDIGSFSLSIIN